MKDKLLQLAEKFDALTQRERATIAGAVLVGGLVVGYLLLIDPHVTRQSAQAKRVTQIKNDLGGVETQMTTLLGE